METGGSTESCGGAVSTAVETTGNTLFSRDKKNVIFFVILSRFLTLTLVGYLYIIRPAPASPVGELVAWGEDARPLWARLVGGPRPLIFGRRKSFPAPCIPSKFINYTLSTVSRERLRPGGTGRLNGLST